MAGNPYLWSTTAATNATADPDINFAEGQAPGSVNDSDRALMAGVAGWLTDTNSTLTTGGSANAQTVTSNVAYAALATGLRLHLKAGFTTTGAATLNLTPAGGAAFGAKAIKVITGSGEFDPVPSAIRLNGHYIFEYDAAANTAAGAWILLNPSSSGPMFIAAATASSSATLDFVGGIDSAYDEYLFVFSNILPATNAVNLQLQISSNAGVSWVTTANYNRVVNILSSAAGGTNTANGSLTDTAMNIAILLSNTTTLTMSGELRLFHPAVNGQFKTFTWLLSYQDGTNMICIQGGGLEGTTSAPVNGIRFKMSSGNIASGTIALYGIRQS